MQRMPARSGMGVILVENLLGANDTAAERAGGVSAGPGEDLPLNGFEGLVDVNNIDRELRGPVAVFAEVGLEPLQRSRVGECWGIGQWPDGGGNGGGGGGGPRRSTQRV